MRDPVHVVHRRRRRRKPGEAALAEIRAMQASTGLIIPKAAVSRLVRELTRAVPGHTNELRWTVPALMAIHEALEAFAVRLFEGSNLASMYCKCVTLMPKDVQLVFKIRDE
eukprot:scaffold126575_cov67-Attheya_sp.AAC.5